MTPIEKAIELYTKECEQYDEYHLATHFEFKLNGREYTAFMPYYIDDNHGLFRNRIIITVKEIVEIGKVGFIVS